MSSIGNRLKEERERLEMTQIEMAEIANITRASQQNYENDRRIPDANYLALIATIGADTKYIIEGVRTDTHSIGLSEEERGAIETVMKILKRVLRVFIF